MAAPTALLVSRAPSVIDSVRDAHTSFGHLPLTICPGLEEACEEVRRKEVALVMVHLLGGGDGGVPRLLRTVATTRRACPTLVLADAYRDEQATTLLNAGAADYLGLPHDLGKLAHLAEILTCRFRSLKGASRVSSEACPNMEQTAEETGLGEMMGQVRRVAAQGTTLLLTGETGTGKTRLARLIHMLSPRRNQPLVILECSSLSATLIESELFGHTKGAFTGADRDRPGKLAAAGRGTLLLDEINSLPLALQSKLLRVVEDRVFEPVGSNTSHPLQARIIAASNASLETEVAENRFRRDLYYRLNVVGFYLPPLRERRTAVTPLARKFLREFAEREGLGEVEINSEAIRALENYDWPGNIRQLRNVIEQGVTLLEGKDLEYRDLPEAVRARNSDWPSPGPSMPVFAANSDCQTLSQRREDAEKRRITEALCKHCNNRLRTAAELGISRMGLYKKLHKYGLMSGAVNG